MLTNLIAKILGLGSLFSKLAGYRTYVLGAAMALSGAAMLLTDVSSLADAASVMAFVKGVALNAGYLKILEGLALMTLRKAVAGQSADAGK